MFRPDFPGADRPCGVTDNFSVQGHSIFFRLGPLGLCVSGRTQMHGPPSSSDLDTDQARFCCPTKNVEDSAEVETGLRELFAAWEGGCVTRFCHSFLLFDDSNGTPSGSNSLASRCTPQQHTTVQL